MRPPLPDTVSLATPALVVERAALVRNLERMAAMCAAAGVRLRAHGKMHKCPTLAHLQMAHGAVGLCCQTLSEAETYAAAGLGNLLITAPIALGDSHRVAALAAKGVAISCVADDARLIQALSAAALAAGVEVPVLVDLDVGHHRTGAPLEDALPLAGAIAAAPGLIFGGLQAYHGAIQHLAPAAREAAAIATSASVRAVIARLAAAGLPPPIVTGGGTGTAATDLAAGVFSELQAGSYALMDAEYAACGVAFEPALFLAASVVSTRAKTHVTIDAGLKALALEVAPVIVAGAPAGSRFQFAGDEHARLLHPLYLERLASAGRDVAAQLATADAIAADPDCPYPEDAPELGARVWLQPGHVDPTINLFDALLIAENGAIVDVWPIAARRRTPSPQ